MGTKPSVVLTLTLFFLVNIFSVEAGEIDLDLADREAKDWYPFHQFSDWDGIFFIKTHKANNSSVCRAKLFRGLKYLDDARRKVLIDTNFNSVGFLSVAFFIKKDKVDCESWKEHVNELVEVAGDIEDGVLRYIYDFSRLYPYKNPDNQTRLCSSEAILKRIEINKRLYFPAIVYEVSFLCDNSMYTSILKFDHKEKVFFVNKVFLVLDE